MTGAAIDPVTEAWPVAKQDLEHLRLLSIFHYVVAGLAALVGCLPIFHLTVGIAMVAGAFPNDSGPPPPPVLGWLFIVIAGAVMAFYWALAIGLLVAGRCLALRRRYLFCMVVAGIGCIFMPFGTVLGVFTLLVLLRPSVKELFGAVPPAADVADTSFTPADP